MVGPKVPNQGAKKKEKVNIGFEQPFLLFVRTIYLAIFCFVRTNESFFCLALGKRGWGCGSLSEAKKSDQNNLSFASGINR